MATAEDAKAKLEIWNREPVVIKEGTINVLDVFLVLKDDNDERVQIVCRVGLRNLILKFSK